MDFYSHIRVDCYLKSVNRFFSVFITMSSGFFASANIFKVSIKQYVKTEEYMQMSSSDWLLHVVLYSKVILAINYCRLHRSLKGRYNVNVGFCDPTKAIHFTDFPI